MIATKPRERVRPSGADAGEYGVAPAPTRSVNSSYHGKAIRRDLVALDPPVRQKNPVTSMVVLFVAAAGAFAYFAHRGHLVGEIASVTMLPCALHGLWRGAFRKSLMLAVTLGLFYVLSSKPDMAGPLVSATGVPAGPVANLIGGGALAMIAWIAAFFAARAIHRRIIAPNRFVGMADRMAGTLIGSAEGALAVLAICWCALSMQPYAQDLVHAPDTAPGSGKYRIGKYMLQISDEANAGLLGQLARVTNPIDQIPALRDAVHQLNTTGQITITGEDLSAMKGLTDLLKDSELPNAVGLGDVLNQIKENSAARDEAYRQQPSPAPRHQADQ